MPLPQIYDAMTEEQRRTAFRDMFKALDKIALGAEPTLKPGYTDYMSKRDIQETATAEIRKWDPGA